MVWIAGRFAPAPRCRTAVTGHSCFSSPYNGGCRRFHAVVCPVKASATHCARAVRRDTFPGGGIASCGGRRRQGRVVRARQGGCRQRQWSPAGQQTNGAADRPGAGRASAQQLRYARQLAAQIPGLEVRRLEKPAANMLHKPLTQLSTADASVLIETLRNILSGEADLDALLEDASAAAE